HFAVVPMQINRLGANELLLVTQRGKQLNSMVHDSKEHATGFTREAILMGAADTARLGFKDGERVRLSNDRGVYEGRVAVAALAAGTVQVYFPEGNVLLDPAARSPKAQVPAYKSGVVRVERAEGERIEAV